MGRKSKEQKELERQEMLKNNPKIKFELDEKVSLKRYLKYYGYSQVNSAGFDHLYESMKDHKVPNVQELSVIMNECGYSCHTLSLNALFNGLVSWNQKRKAFVEPKVVKAEEKVTSPVKEEVKKEPVIVVTGVTIVEDQPKTEPEVKITTNVEPEAPVTEVKIDEPTVEAKPKRRRGRKSKAEKEAERLAAEQAAQNQETSNDNQ